MDERYAVVAPVWGLTTDKQIDLGDFGRVFPTPGTPDLTGRTKAAKLLLKAIEIEEQEGGIELDAADGELIMHAKVGAIRGLVQPDIHARAESWHSFVKKIWNNPPQGCPAHEVREVSVMVIHIILFEPLLGEFTEPDELEEPELIAGRMPVTDDDEEWQGLLGQFVASLLHRENPQLSTQLWNTMFEARQRESKAIQAAKDDQVFIQIMDYLMEDWATGISGLWQDFKELEEELPGLHNDVTHLRNILATCSSLVTFKMTYQQAALQQELDLLHNFDGRPFEQSPGSFLSNAALGFTLEAKSEEKAKEGAEQRIEEFLIRCRSGSYCRWCS